jgi:hypothetical protein
LARAALVSVAVAIVLAPGPADAAAPLTLGVDTYGALGNPSVRDPWIAQAATEGASFVRVSLGWSAVAPATRPSGFRDRDPGSPYYNWSAIDSMVRAVAAKRLTMLMVVSGAPQWGEGSHRPAGTAPGSWRPSPQPFGRFAHAAALRYSGRWPDPLAPGHYLPRVRFWEAWNEPNLSLYLTPQWTRTGGRWTPASPNIYRHLLNAFYSGIKIVSRKNVVVAGATAPFGDLNPGQPRMQPVTFVRTLLCLRGARLTSAGCKDRAHFDVLDHHPFDIGGPLKPALDAGDVATPDMGKLTRLLRAAGRGGTIAPRGRKRVWATELLWESRPPAPEGVPPQQQAHWLEQALYVLWRAGVDTIFWLQIVDDPPPHGLAAGLYFGSGRAKPAATAFRFPFVTVRESPRLIRAWGRAPAGGTLLIQVHRGKAWITLRRMKVRWHSTFFAPVGLAHGASLRARVGPDVSLSWYQR